ncbi:hypothetical protein BDC45DRAFT_524381, partial [Circinella umbellata]
YSWSFLLFPTWDICAIFGLRFLLHYASYVVIEFTIYYSSLAYYILCNHNNYNRIILHQSFFLVCIMIILPTIKNK